MSNYMGVDIGTSGCKAAVFDENGDCVTRAYREYDVVSTQSGWAELDSDEVIGKCFESIREAASGVEGGSVRGLGISSQGEAFTPIDEEGKALCHAFVSSDTRAAEYAESWSREFGAERLYGITGHTPHPLFSLFKLLWLRDNRPEIWSSAKRFLCFEDLLQFRLGLNPAMGWPLAGRTMLFDVIKHTWSQEILNAVGMEVSQLARPLQSGSISGRLGRRMAEELGLTEGAYVVTAGHDQPCSALGAGAVEPGVAVYATGTVECITPAFSKPVFSDVLRVNNLCTYDHAMPGMYATVAFSLTGGNILKWFRDEFGAPEIAEAAKRGCDPYELLTEAAGDMPSQLLVLPHFTPTGTPYFDTSATGAILGLRLSTRRGEVIRALLEGVTYEMRLNLDILEQSGCVVNELRAIGGGAKSDIWNQLKADVLGKKITVLDVGEAGCSGAAMLAKAATGDESLREIAARWVKPVGAKRPRGDVKRIYDERFETYRKLYSNLKELRF